MFVFGIIYSLGHLALCVCLGEREEVFNMVSDQGHPHFPYLI